jgi:deoxyribose-phosphate aldolase
MTNLDANQLAAYIDHTLLKATTTSDHIKQLCNEARRHNFAAVSVSGRWVPLAADQLHGTNVKVGGVVSLPLGGDSTDIKAAAAKDCIFAGADEIDIVADLAAIIEGDRHYLAHQLLAVLKVCRSMRPKVLLKVIIESAALTNDQKIFACSVANDCGVDFVKTGTGMNPAGGATLEDVKLLKEHAPNCRVKAAGGIRTAAQTIEMINAGADRIGTSSGLQIMEQFEMEKQQ